ncbi:arsenate reductase (glutaredoxin) [Paucibacter sp. AS339]|uniref:arsenate reductase (glutaredoxin) n=1 Tax=Paucibacter hankyongi TaxID=3133434 RepID=UPI0030A00987
MTIRIFHNPRCSKSREALALLQARSQAVEVVDYLKAPPTLAELQALQQALALPVRDMLRSNEEEYQALQLDAPQLSEAELLAALAAHPRLLQRPIVVAQGRAVIARPPELALSLL